MEQEFMHLKGKSADAFGDIPENYFRDLPDKILLRSKTGNRKAFYLRPSLIAAAAGLLILIGLAMVLIFTNNTPMPDYADDIRLTDSVREMIASGDLSVKAGMKDSAGMVTGDNVIADKHIDDSTDQAYDIFDTLEDIPIEVLIEYLLTSNEYKF